MTATHELQRYLESVGADLTREYERITARSKEDSGTAGDEAEENWAEVLRGWLPPQYPVVTKGRIIFLDGSASPQVDILVLRPSYPSKLRDKKAYLAGGVVAAFECKLTLRKRDLDKICRTCAYIKSRLEPRGVTLFDELNRSILFGVLAHAHAIRSRTKKWEEALLDSLAVSHSKHCDHPSSLVDLVAIASDAAFLLNKSYEIAPHTNPDLEWGFLESGFSNGGVVASYGSSFAKFPRAFTLGSMIFALLRHLAFQDSSLCEFADYFRDAGTLRAWIARVDYMFPPDSLSASVIERITDQGFESETWSRWSKIN